VVSSPFRTLLILSRRLSPFMLSIDPPHFDRRPLLSLSQAQRKGTITPGLFLPGTLLGLGPPRHGALARLSGFPFRERSRHRHGPFSLFFFSGSRRPERVASFSVPLCPSPVPGSRARIFSPYFPPFLNDWSLLFLFSHERAPMLFTDSLRRWLGPAHRAGHRSTPDDRQPL